MDVVAVAMVLGSAALHALWNLLAKRSSEPLAYFFAIVVTAVIIYAAPFTILALNEEIAWDWLRFAILSGGIHVAYFTLLARAYARADLSFAYPIARGTGLMLVPLLAMPVFDDRPTAAAWIGILLVVAGIVLLHVPLLAAAARRADLAGLFSFPAFLTGLTIALYSVNDAAGVRRANPIVYLFVVYAVCALLLAPYMIWRNRAATRNAFRLSAPLLIGGAGSFGTYMTVLAATKLAPVAYVVPMRETSIVIGALLGARLLNEPLGPIRIAACLTVVAGVMTIAIGG